MNIEVQFTETNMTSEVNFTESSESDIPAGLGEMQFVAGKDGKSAYEIALDHGFKGTEAEWVESLQGEDGYTPVKGVDYFDGEDGYTPVKGVDYFDGKDGKDGSSGKDGMSATHSWNGTVLTVTSSSGTSSADLKGAQGNPGKTPVKGVDYFDGAPGPKGDPGEPGGMVKKLLWENPNPFSEYDEKDETVDVRGYDAVEIIAHWESDPVDCNVVSSGYIPLSFDMMETAAGERYANGILTSLCYPYFSERPYVIYEEYIRFRGCYEHDWTVGNGGPANYALIPYQIYGIKLGAAGGGIETQEIVDAVLDALPKYNGEVVEV